MRAVALIVAGGSGSRFGGPVPKQYRRLAGVPVLRRTVETFLTHPAVGRVQVVIRAEDTALYADAVAGLDLPPPVIGGADRQESVRLGLEVLAGVDVVLIQDAARPCVPAPVIDRVLAAVQPGAGAIAALPVADTLWRGPDAVCDALVDRQNLWRAQTPQGFMLTDILAAHRATQGQGLTDDAAVAMAAGLKVHLVEGSPVSAKITTEADLTEAETRLRQNLTDIRVGTGFDVHAFADGDSVTLCGLTIPHTCGLAGHSDADVGLHALTDAILGALAAGDIGQHFPPSDPRWKGADSAQFLRHAADLVAARGGVIAHTDVTLICERPKVGPHRAAMQARVAEILGLALDRVSIKATTTEKLGFTGREEGIAAQAVATLRLPE
ncbi:bifunctional 2-C-methyl-D-erythritol 4-phosphate cytidylyltransferase/2-C-methyl-D-erythritol 2,4-cyclodiphosphate synthase [Elstera cyanobacteriorum]|uniref:bifunctional 2-C-methyl-D-erythritol 4-phosphate cytidylyltransferase/2-C-methyl-D-erythritol 2,4-cyclodiphosphate synthase n=1 Tax=Elstera cyanobacteriorum TaxID=2022747 RepID=UPI0023534806|nr:bifunctional 2-C-methyl-D-erythritol 4-phosphate cytidylyltransferase/2-C-methyl-D-erythritol 2,4-cyclodiphosphate synthase [Elstera cyanobacteriorum]MCK6442125.1 bifunctional 2-C-methyl-D-erythritol 4-phosphate cytidylyltransferase/2-C-methyl-D-erythritol 2,4-cyclodiphosphate synthase [Elstera cyanobacteriorum]